MKRFALDLSFAVLAASACTLPTPQTGASPADPGWTLVEAKDWSTRAPDLIGKAVELHGNLSTQMLVDPGSSFSNTGAMRATNYSDALATVLFDQIGKEQITWMAMNKCYVTCEEVFVRGIVEIVGTGPVLDMMDISCKSRAGGVAPSRAKLASCATWDEPAAIRAWQRRPTQVRRDSAAAMTVPAPNAQAEPVARTRTSAAADSEWTLVQASDWRTRAPRLIGKRVELSGDLSTEDALVDPRSSLSNRGAMRGQIRRAILAIVLFDQISNDQVKWMWTNKCLLTCKGVFVRGVVVIVGAGPVLQMIDVSSESRAGGSAATPALAAPALTVQEVRASQTGASASDSGWTLVRASDWRTRAPGLIGKRVELSGDLSTQFYVNPHESFSNIGTMRGSSGKDPLATVLFDQISTEQAAWFSTNKCNQTCVGVFVRGVVLSELPGRMCGPPPRPRCPETPSALRMSDISFESRAGGVAASVVQPDAAHGDTPAVQKQLLPPGGLPEPHRDLNLYMGVIRGPARRADFETSYRSIRDTRLLKVFANYPWNGGSNQWPRVALVVEEKPTHGANGFPQARGRQKIEDGCWRLRARLWSGPATSEDIAPFNWCLSEMRLNVAYDEVALWGRNAYGTQSDRTLGPNAPLLPVPTFQYRDGLRGDTIMLGNILLDMSFGLGMRDSRVWIVQ